MPEEKPRKTWVVSLGGGEWATIQYGIVEYLRRHPRMRVATVCLGLAWVVGWLLTTMGFKWHSVVFPSIATLFAAPTLLWLAVVSGPDFELAFAAPKTIEPKPEVSKVKGLIDAESYGIEALNTSLTSAEGYGRSGFRWAVFCLLTGITSGCVAVWLANTRPLLAMREHTGTFVWVACASFFVLSALFLIRSMLQFRRANSLQDKLLDLQKTLTAIRLVEFPHGEPLQISASFVANKLLGKTGGESDS